MTALRVGDDKYDVEVVVFDKDGLLFDSQHFWNGLAKARICRLQRIDGFPVDDWCQIFGIQWKQGGIGRVDPLGIFALAAPSEEVVVTASLFRKHLGTDWGECRKQAAAVFDDSDRDFDLIGALQPKSGFPEIFKRLRTASIPYGIATSDNDARTRFSIAEYDRLEDLQFIITPVDVKYGKPNPDMLHLVAEQSRVPLEKIMMIGDSFVDMLMAKRAGCIGIGIPDDPDMKRMMEPYASSIIESLEEIGIL